MSKESSYELLQVKRWRAITYDFEALSTNLNISRAYCLTDFQVAWLLSNTDYMRWLSRWNNCPCTENDMEAMAAELEYNLMNCIDIQPYQLQYLYQKAEDDYFEHLNDLWAIDPTPSEINPSTPDDFYSGDDSVERIDALCTACKIYVYSYAQNWVVKAQTVLGIVAVVGLFASITIVGGVIASLLVGGLAFITSIALSAMQDMDALNDVVCCMFNDLDGKAITQANFITALDGCGFEEGSNASIVRDIVASDMNQLSNWLAFLDSLGDAYDLALIGVVDCPCEEPWEHTFDFSEGDGDFEIFSPAGNLNEFGTYSFPTGWTTTDSIFDTSPTQYRRAVAIERTWTVPTTLTSLSVVYSVTKGSYSSPITALNCQMKLGATTQAQSPESNAVLTNGTDKTKTVTATVLADGIRFYVGTSSQGSATYSGSCVVKSVTVHGIGFNPFA